MPEVLTMPQADPSEPGRRFSLSDRNAMQLILMERNGADNTESRGRWVDENSARFRKFVEDPENKALVMKYLESKDGSLVLEIERRLKLTNIH